MVDQRVLFTLKLEFVGTRLQVYMVKVDVEVIRLGILVDGEDLHKSIIPNGRMSDDVEEELAQVLKQAKSLAADFPSNAYNDIKSGRFAERI
jgi:hypothetical protein